MSARRRHQRSIWYLAAASIAALAATACSSSASPGTTASSGPLTIGMSLPMTGPVADVSKSGLQGYQLWASQQNASGGLLGHQLKLDVLDDGFDPNQTATDYTRLISQDKVNLVLGTFSSLLNAPASAIAARQGMLYVEPSGGAASLFTRGFTNLFFAQPGTTTSEPDRFVAWIASLPPSQRPATAAYVTQDDPSASPAVAVFQTRLRALGIKTVYDQTYDPSTTNFDSIAASIAHARPQLVIQGAVADDGAAFVRSLEKINFSPRMLFQTNAPSDSAYPAAIGRSNAEGVFTAEAWSPQAKYPGNAAFVAAYTKKFGSPPTEDAANSYTAGQVLAAAIRAVGRVDQKALAAWLHTHTVSTIVGPLKWNSAGDPEGSLLLAQWQGGKLQIVAPKSAATTSHIVTVKLGLGQLMIELTQALIFGVLMGSVYALMATGLTLTFGVMKIVNMAQGAFLVLSAYLCYGLWSRFGIDPLLGGFIVTVPMALLGVALYRLVIERVQRIDPGLTIVATFALALVAEACIALVWGPNPTASTPGYFNQAFRVGSLVVPQAQFYACLLAVGVTVALQAVVRRSWLGHAITAASENPEGARLVGVQPARVGAWIFAIATATSAFGGAALSFLYQFTPDSQDVWIGLTLSVVILGGLGSIPGAFAAGLLLGVAEAVTSTYISVRWSAAVPTLLILVVLLIRPQGLFTRAARPDAAT